MLELRRARAMDALQFVEMLAVDFGVRAEKIEMCAQRLPLAFGLRLLLRDLMALTLMNVKDIYLQILGPSRHVGEYSCPFAQLSDHVAADVAREDRARERVLEQDLDHLM